MGSIADGALPVQVLRASIEGPLSSMADDPSPSAVDIRNPIVLHEEVAGQGLGVAFPWL